MMYYRITFKNNSSVLVDRSTLDAVFNGMDQNKNAQFETVWATKEGTNQKELVVSVQILEIVSIHPEP